MAGRWSTTQPGWRGCTLWGGRDRVPCRDTKLRHLARPRHRRPGCRRSRNFPVVGDTWAAGHSCWTCPRQQRKTLQDWIFGRDQAWRERITVATLDPFRGHATALRSSLPQETRVLASRRRRWSSPLAGQTVLPTGDVSTTPVGYTHARRPSMQHRRRSHTLATARGSDPRRSPPQRRPHPADADLRDRRRHAVKYVRTAHPERFTVDPTGP